jgi:hypothetical protein
VAIELTLLWNSTEGVYDVQSTGQLIPLITGLLSFGGLLQEIVTVYLREANVSCGCAHQKEKENLEY